MLQWVRSFFSRDTGHEHGRTRELRRMFRNDPQVIAALDRIEASSWFLAPPTVDAAIRKVRTVSRCHSFSPSYRDVAIKRARELK